MKLRLLLLALLAAAGLWALQRWPEAAHGLRGVAAVPWPAWLLVAAGLSASYMVRALRLHAEWHAINGVGRRECLHVTLQHTAAVHLLPMRTGELGFPLLLKQRWGVPFSEAMACLVALRVQDMCVVGLLGVVSVAAVGAMAGRVGPWVAAAGVTTAVLAWLALALPLRRASRAWPGADDLARPAWRRWLVLLGTAWRRTTLRTWGLTLVNWTLKLGTLALLYAAGAVHEWAAAWMCALGGDAGAALPVQPAAGFGTFEAGAAMLGHWAGTTTPLPALLGAALGVHLVLLAYAVVAALLMGLFHGASAQPGSMLPRPQQSLRSEPASGR